MRGPGNVGLRQGRQPRLPATPTGIPKSVPAPIGGWNTREPLADMPPTDAVVMDNFYPATGTVNLRPGRLVWASGLPAPGKSLMVYTNGLVSKLFVSTNANLYDVTTSGTVGASVAACTSGKWEYRNMTTSGGSFLVAVNGVDPAKFYNGTSWAVLNSSSSPSITGLDTSTFTNVNLFKRRLWFTVKNSLSAWYLPVNSFGGALTEFPFGPVFSKGGYIVAQANWTWDGGNGSDDYLVTVTSEGEAAVYMGTDPSQAGTFSLVGTYAIGKPVGKKCFTKYGGDLLYLSRQGIFPLSKLLQSASLDKTKALSDKIDEAFKGAVLVYGDTFGWSVNLHPTQSAVIINVAMTEDQASVQFVMNDLTKAWCRFTGWDATAFDVFGTEMYSVLGSKVYRNWTGTMDDTSPIVGKCQQAYLAIGASSKIIQLVKPNLTVQGSVTVQTAVDSDFGLFTGVAEDSYINYLSTSSLWDQGTWDTATWSPGLVPIAAKWTTCSSNPGVFHSMRLQVTSATATLNWTSTDYVIQRGGIL